MEFINKKEKEPSIYKEALVLENKSAGTNANIRDFLELLWENKIGLRARKLCELPLLLGSRSILRIEYLSVCKLLNRTNAEAGYRTSHENSFLHAFRRRSRIKGFQMYWIGPYNCDLFFPQISSEKPGTRGLVVEIDGGIHYAYGKSRKDNSKREFIGDLNIAVTSIENETVFEAWAGQFQKEVIKIPRLSSMQRWKVLQTVQLATILSQRSAQRTFNLLLSEKNSEISLGGGK